jgi:hypothetical protein
MNKMNSQDIQDSIKRANAVLSDPLAGLEQTFLDDLARSGSFSLKSLVAIRDAWEKHHNGRVLISIFTMPGIIRKALEKQNG